MEHRLILGGEQFLPFARSRIKALKALGLAHASQSFEIDGASIKVRIEPGHEYIRIEGGACTLEMDSGVFDVLTIAPESPVTYSPGVLHVSDGTTAYNAAFIPDPSGIPGKINPSKNNKGQFSGKVSFDGKKFRGRILDPQAFSPRLVASDPPTTPPSFVPDTRDENLYYKKLVSALCPPSIFTGRCRLYVQAMYGTPLYTKNKDGSMKSDNPPPEIENSTSAAPGLWLTPYRDQGDATQYDDVLLDTSCGVWLDVMTGNHWLIQPNNGIVRVYPLKSKPCGEKLRNYLKTANNTLDKEDKRHLEAYILAYCKPDVKRRQIAGAVDTGGYYSMGYGWHWNYAGTQADMVINGSFHQEGIAYAMTSTHYRIVMNMEDVPEPPGGFAPDALKVRWSVELVVIEGPKPWSVLRAWWAITEPDFQRAIQVKVTPSNSLLFDCDAPFYAFYKGDALQVCRVKVTSYPPADAYRTLTPGYSTSSEYRGPNEKITLGELPGHLEDHRGTLGYPEAVFSCGDYTMPALPISDTKVSDESAITDKEFNGFWSFGYGPDWQFADRVYATGYPPYEYKHDPWMLSASSRSAGLTYKETAGTRFVERQGTAEIVIPLFDAEAVYFKCDAYTDTTFTGYETLWTNTDAENTPANGSEFKVKSVSYNPYTQVSTEYVRYGYARGGSASGHFLLEESPVSTYDREVTAKESVLICSAGKVPAVFTHVNEFHANELDEVGTSYHTKSNAKNDSPILIAPTHVATVGVSADITVPVITGWA